MKYTILSVVLYRYKTWSLKLRVKTQANGVQKQRAKKDIWDREAVTGN
jgi:hypothetical protein